MIHLTIQESLQIGVDMSPFVRPSSLLPLCGLVLIAACSSDSTEPDSQPEADTSTSDTTPEADASTDDDAAEEDAGPAVPSGCQFFGTEGATATCLEPTFPPEYYVAEAEAYFDTLDIDADRQSVPNYHPNVARWEWPPWLLLTALTADEMISTATSLRTLDPSTVPERDCRFFEVQPFARCYIEFEYERGRCPIYEEFVFNDAGEMTFIEAWSDIPGLLPNSPDDPWGEASDYPRLSTRVPGLGNSTGSFADAGDYLAQASTADPEVADFLMRTTDWWAFWFEEIQDAEDDFFGVGCGWPPEE